MTSESPTAHLARLRVNYPLWRIWKGEATGEWWASPPVGHPHQTLINAADLPALEVKLQEAERRPEP